ncbi:MAG: sorbosone dehydrogenase family protein [Acidisphaera sp.]|nr:sorbosone dehydrogenase family protein [Acidisphaera sp.]
MHRSWAAWVGAAVALAGAAAAQSERRDDWRADAPGVVRRITPADLPAPYASHSASNGPSVARRLDGAVPRVPAGFTVQLYASGLAMPRTMRVAPNGDVFLAESGADRVRVFRAPDGAARPAQSAVFATGVTMPFGLAFYPPGPDPHWLYVAGTDRVVRFPYRSGDLRASGPAEVIVRRLPEGGHWTRDIVAAPDGAHLFLSVGSGSNIAPGLAREAPRDLAAWQAQHGLGAAWGAEAGRAAVFMLDPLGEDVRTYATGLRNCSGEAIEPATGVLWCVTNERDGLGDNLPPDYATQVRQGAFYGWPWFYIGDHEDPRHRGERPDLAGQVSLPDVLIQAHSAPLGIAFYTGAMFPPDYRGDAFVALHGSWNRSERTGYKVIRLRFADGRPTGGYEDFLTGFVAGDSAVWGRPVGVAVAHDGALLVSEDGNDTIWRVSR